MGECVPGRRQTHLTACDGYRRTRCPRALRRGRSAKKYLKMYPPSRPCSGPPHLRQLSCWSGKVSFVSTRTSLYWAPQFGQSNGVVSVIGMTLAGFDVDNVLH
jgi:hypothetical protein